jgi:nucleotide-binding universal stress UspA family protein
MGLQDILVLLDAQKASEDRLRLATAIARNHGARLEAIYLPPREAAEPLPSIGSPRSWGTLGDLTPRLVDVPSVGMLADIAECRFHDHLRLSGIQGEWRSFHRARTSELITRTLAADLIILGQTDPHARPAPTVRPETIVATSSRPTLLVPYIGSYPQIGRRVLIAWDGTRAAARAVSDALPLMRDAEAATVMTVRGSEKEWERDRPAVERIVEHLARHGIAARSDRLLNAGSPASDVLLSRAVDLAADLIVAGGCGRSGMRGMFAGGISRGLFRRMTVPVLMSH